MSRYVRNIWHDGAAHVYRVRVMVRGRRYKRSFSYREDAAEWVRMLQREAAGLPTPDPAYTLAQARAAYGRRLEERGSGEETERYYASKWRALAGVLGEEALLGEIDQRRIGEYVLARRGAKRPAANRTVRAELTLLHRCYPLLGIQAAWEVPELRIETHRRAVPPPEAVARLWMALDGPPLVALALCLLTGMRASEAMRLQAADVDRQARTIRLTRRKAGDELVVAVVPTLARLLPARGRLVAAGDWQVRAAIRNASRRAGVTPAWSGPGLGRHCFATWARERCGYTTEQIADALGHSRPGLATTHYLHAQAVEPLLRPMARAVERVFTRALRGTPARRRRTLGRQ